MDYVIIVNDNGELKTISAAELERGWTEKQKNSMQSMLNLILDIRALAETQNAAEMERYADPDAGNNG